MENEQIVIELKELLYMEFRRYLYRRKANVTAQSILLAIGYNINKLHHKIQAGRTGRHLFPLKQTAWFWQVKSKSWKRTFFQKRFIKVRLFVETEWKKRIFRLKNGKKMLPHLWFPNHWCDSSLPRPGLPPHYSFLLYARPASSKNNGISTAAELIIK